MRSKAILLWKDVETILLDFSSQQSRLAVHSVYASIMQFYIEENSFQKSQPVGFQGLTVLTVPFRQVGR